MLTNRQKDDIAILFEYGFTKDDIASGFGVKKYLIQNLTTKIGIQRGFGFMADIPKELKGYDKKFLENKNIYLRASCKDFCQKNCDACNPEHCGYKISKEYLFKKIIFSVNHHNDLMSLRHQKQLERDKKKNKNIKASSVEMIFKDTVAEKMNKLGLKYQDVPPHLLKKFNAMTEQNNRMAGFNPRNVSLNLSGTTTYSWVY